MAMEMHIYISNKSSTGLHYGSQSGYERFNGTYFEKLECDENNLIDKAIINKIKYEPDSIYRDNDGYGGTCWCAEIIDPDEQGYIYYHFRNFENLVKFYEEKGYKFIQIVE
jgi:hypothetical protein